MDELIQDMLDSAADTGSDEDGDKESDGESQTMLVFKDLKGQIWQLVRRDDLKSFDELVEMEDEDDA